MGRDERAEISLSSPGWLGAVPSLRAERHFGDRVVRCFAPRPKSAYALLGEAVAANASGEALVCGQERLTYRRFEQIVEGWAASLARMGVVAGDRVALLLGNGIAFPAALFAILRLGAIGVPISIREQTPGLAYMLADCGAKVLVHDAELSSRLPAAAQTPQLRWRVALPPDAPDGGLQALEQGPGSTPIAEVNEEDTAIILYTSGTTGRPKGALLTHLGICHSAMHYQCCMGLGASDRSIVAVPLSHVTGVVALLAALVRVAG